MLIPSPDASLGDGDSASALSLPGMDFRNISALLLAKLLIDNNVADVADFPTRNARVQVDG